MARDQSSETDEASSARSADRADTVEEYRGTGIMWTGFALVAALALLVVVAFQNTHDVGFEFLWFETQLPLILILLITFGLAVLGAESIGFVWRHRRRRRLQERAELKRLRENS
ncbi:MAG: lipopolysaccharide assembly protein LapA domain-containing protein [Ilumatobacteraceae bacterium]|nr:lipopolysaccharide assembly protein LapA domain-containing protein [Ilumatobacteraceae bacterium]